MDPCPARHARLGPGFPRTRGDGPAAVERTRRPEPVSPHTRGWTPVLKVDATGAAGFPAHAGMDPSTSGRRRPTGGFPRTRGDGPLNRPDDDGRRAVSPHTRGWTRPASPRLPGERGFPAHAGMDPRLLRQRRSRLGFPRTRGDGPRRVMKSGPPIWVSPHTRGWTRVASLSGSCLHGFPAHAGMDPRASPRGRLPTGFPRTRGDGPSARCDSAESISVSPHTRGWTHVVRIDQRPGSGFPAHAGMDP